jgi:large subunit ribosomal protein L24
MKVKKNDNVLVVTGKDAGKIGKVLVALPKDNKVVVDGVNLQKKHKKARSAQDVSKIETINGAIDASNVMVVCPKCDKAIRVAYKIEGDKKVRVCKKCGAILDGAKEVKEVKETAKKSTKAKAEATETTDAPAKKTTRKSTKKADKAE